jgi:hypothetical protein
MGMDEEVLTNTLQAQENQILSMRRELNGIHASITDVEVRVNKTRFFIICSIILFWCYILIQIKITN